MNELWETTFRERQLMWGLEPARSAVLAKDHFVRMGVGDVLVPGVGYGRNAKLFVEHGMSVTGIEVSATAIALARSQLGLVIPIHHGSVADMPYDRHRYGGVFCHGLIYLLDAGARAKLLGDCSRQLLPGGHLIFSVISKEAPMYGRGPKLGDDRYEVTPGVAMYFYDAASVEREFGPHGLIEQTEIDEQAVSGASLPFIHVVCRNR
jgi:SAM-dependent methyltransferase